MNMTEEKILDAIETASKGIVHYRPFYAFHYMDMKLEYVKEKGMIASTDGFKNIWINPEELANAFNNGLVNVDNDADMTLAVSTIIIHEIMHRVLVHTTRMKGKILPIYNLAGDFIIHKLLEEDKFYVSKNFKTKDMDEWINMINSSILGDKKKFEDDQKIFGIAYDPRLSTQWKDWGTDKVYDYIMQNLSQEAKEKLEQAQQACGIPLTREDLEKIREYMEKNGLGELEIDIVQAGSNESENDMIREVLKNANSEALKHAKLQGSGSVPFEGEIEVAEEAKVPWWKYLARFIRVLMARDDWSYRRQTRRFGADPSIIRPGRLSIKFGEVACIVDVSGSMSDRALGQIAAEVQNAISKAKPEKIHVIYSDDEVTHVDTFGPYDKLEFKRYGYGGTSFIPAFNYIKENLPNVDVIILFTDGYGDFPSKSPGIPTFFGAICDPMEEKHWPKWGKLVYIEDYN